MQIIAIAAILTVMKGASYFVVFWMCAIRTIPPREEDRPVARAFRAAVFRALLGVAAIPLFIYLLQGKFAESLGTYQLVQVLVRLLMWLIVSLLAYRTAAFRSPGARLRFVLYVLVAGTLLNLAWDHLIIRDGRLLYLQC